MNTYVARPIRGRPYYMLSKLPTYKTVEVDLPDEECERINQVLLDFNYAQALLAQLYHKYDEKLHAEGIE